MKIFLMSILLVSLVTNLFGQSQTEMNSKAKKEYEIVDKELNRVYQKILFDYKKDTIFIQAMKEAQRQWIKFRDAQLKMKYPVYKEISESVLPMCRSVYLKELTNNRINELKQWVDGTEEGDICSGSIKIK